MNNLLSCRYNMDTNRVEARFADGSAVAIDCVACVAIEDEYRNTPAQRAELDWLLYNRPQEYAQLVLSGEIEHYLSLGCEHRFVTIWGSTVHKHGRSVQLKIIISAHMNLILVICHCKRSAFQRSRSPENVEISGEPYQKEIKTSFTSLFCIKKRPGSLVQ